jgi:hypothetical protein
MIAWSNPYACAAIVDPGARPLGSDCRCRAPTCLSAIATIGDEIVEGRILNENATWLAKALMALRLST